MPIIDKTYFFDGTECSFVFGSQQNKKLPTCLTKNFALFLKQNAFLWRAGQNSCGEKAKFMGKRIEDSPDIQNVKLLVMNDWLSREQPQTPYCSNGFTTGASYHALCYFEYNHLFFACDLNLNSFDDPYLQIFVSENQSDLWRMLNGIYACKDLYLLNIEQSWTEIFNTIQKTKEFDQLLSIEAIFSEEIPTKTTYSTNTFFRKPTQPHQVQILDNKPSSYTIIFEILKNISWAILGLLLPFIFYYHNPLLANNSNHHRKC